MRFAAFHLKNVIPALLLIFFLSASSQARIGERLEEMKKTDFFTFFNLKESDRSKDKEGHTVINFRPGRSGEFPDVVTVSVTLDNDEQRILNMGLMLARSFIDNPTKAIFARDVAKSFIRVAIPEADEPAINDLANEIEFPKELPGYTIERARPDPKLPAQPTPGYLVYLGKRKIHTQQFSKSFLSLTNVKAGEVDALVIAIYARR